MFRTEPVPPSHTWSKLLRWEPVMVPLQSLSEGVISASVKIVFLCRGECYVTILWRKLLLTIIRKIFKICCTMFKCGSKRIINTARRELSRDRHCGWIYDKAKPPFSSSTPWIVPWSSVSKFRITLAGDERPQVEGLRSSYGSAISHWKEHVTLNQSRITHHTRTTMEVKQCVAIDNNTARFTRIEELT